MTLPGQMELATVIDHEPENKIDERKPAAYRYVHDYEHGNGWQRNATDFCEAHHFDDERKDTWRNITPLFEREDTHKPLGVRLAKMLGQYDDSPSSQLWSEIQGLALEILR